MTNFRFLLANFFESKTKLKLLAATTPLLGLLAFRSFGEMALVTMALFAPLVIVLARPLQGNDGSSLERDPINGLLTRSGFEVSMGRTIDHAIAAGKKTGCFVLEIDDYTKLTTRHGTELKSAMDKVVATRLIGVMRHDDLIAHLDDGKFALAFSPVHRADLETLIQTAARLQAACAEPVLLGATKFYITASVGFCLHDRAPKKTGKAYVSAAENALGAAKVAGPASIRSFDPSAAPRPTDFAMVKGDIEAALETGQILPWFQPQVSTETGKITGAEALARWHHPERGILEPSAFLPVVIEAGLSDRLGELVLFGALSALKRWDSAGIHLPRVSVNFSGEELRNPKLVEKIRWELDRFDLKPNRLSVEVLETVVSNTDDDMITRNLSALSLLGCGIDLDDFGVGQTSIGNILRFSVNRIKIDRSFVSHVDEDDDQRRVISAILSMADRLGLETVAEGVETLSEHAILAQLGCQHVQGFGLARPMPPEDLPLWLERHNAKLTDTPKIGRKTT